MFFTDTLALHPILLGVCKYNCDSRVDSSRTAHEKKHVSIKILPIAVLHLGLLGQHLLSYIICRKYLYADGNIYCSSLSEKSWYNCISIANFLLSTLPSIN